MVIWAVDVVHFTDVVAGVVGVGKLLQVLKSGETGPAMELQSFFSESRSWQRLIGEISWRNITPL